MMGKQHAASGAATWLIGCAIAASEGAQPDPRHVFLGAGLFAFGAVWPDIDQRSSTVARSLGPPSRWIAGGVARFGAWLHAATRTSKDRRDEDGHRVISHSLIGCALTVALFGWLGDQWHPWGPLITVFWMVGTAAEAIWGNDTKATRAWVLLVTAAVTTGFWVWPPPSGWWIGWAVGGGALVHCLGDALTNTGVPLFFPIKIKGQRWYCVRTREEWRFSTGRGDDGPEDEIWAGCMFASAAAIVAMAYYAWPWLPAYLLGHIQALAG